MESGRWKTRSTAQTTTIRPRRSRPCTAAATITDYEKVDGRWFIAGQKLHRVKLEFTY